MGKWEAGKSGGKISRDFLNNLRQGNGKSPWIWFPWTTEKRLNSRKERKESKSFRSQILLNFSLFLNLQRSLEHPSL